MSFDDNIRNWVVLDNKIKLMNEQLRDMRAERTDICVDLHDYAKENNLEQHVIQITDGKLKFANNKLTAPITLKYLEKCLSDIIADSDKVSQIIEYIKTNREIKYSSEIKRYSNG
jgi:hypothetical protein